MWKEPCRRRVIDNVQTNLTEFDMFMSQNDYAYAHLQTPLSIDKSIQLVFIGERFKVVVEDLILDVPNGTSNHGVDSAKEYEFSFNNDG